MQDTIYLGDGLYAAHDGYAVSLHTEREGGVRHYVVLEPDVFRALLKWVTSVEHDHGNPGYWSGLKERL